MGTFVFRWLHPANDVHVTGTFDDWANIEKLEKVGDVFEKEVTLPSADTKYYYKFVVDDMWTTDHEAPQEEDGYYNVNNILLPEQIKRKTTTMPETTSNSATGTSETPPGSNRHSVTAVTGLAAAWGAGAAMLSSVSPQSTTAGLADEVPKEGKKDVGAATISSAAPQSTTAGPLPQEQPGSDVSPPLPSQPVPQEDITNLITKLERQSVKALALKDASVSFLAPNSTRVSSKGLVYTHKPSGKEWQRWIKPEMSEIHVLRVAEGVAIIYYQTKAELFDRPGSLRTQL